MTDYRTEAGRNSDMPSDNQLTSWVRWALRHLYEPSVLTESPLIELLGLAACANPTVELRQLLVREVRTMAPPADAPIESELRRAYEVLLYRYLQHDNQVSVADQLGISTRHLRRVERQAIQALTERLQPLIGQRPQGISGYHDREVPAGEAETPDAATDELAWLNEMGESARASIRDVLPAVLELVSQLAERHAVQIEVAGSEEDLPAVVAHPVALKQMLLNLLTVAIGVTKGGRVTLAVRRGEASVELCVEGAGHRPDLEPSVNNALNLAMARKLAKTCGAQLTLEQTSTGMVAVATLHSLEAVPVLVIDDNVDTIRLLQRYVTDTRYRVLGVANLEETFPAVERRRPEIIVLDVMMPNVDGWEILGLLRQHPLTGDIPVVICTILSQQELALSLGASGFIHKPINRRAFLEALDQVLPSKVPRSS